MENLIYISAALSILIFCICHKWTNLFQKVCMFCVVGWVSIACGLIGMFLGIRLDPMHLLTDIVTMFKTIFFIWACTSVFYFYLKHLYE